MHAAERDGGDGDAALIVGEVACVDYCCDGGDCVAGDYRDRESGEKGEEKVRQHLEMRD